MNTIRKVTCLGYLCSVENAQVSCLVPWDRLLPGNTAVEVRIQDDKLRRFTSYVEVGFPPDCAVHVNNRDQIIEVVPGFYDPNQGITKVLGHGLSTWHIYRGSEKVGECSTPFGYYGWPGGILLSTALGFAGFMFYTSMRTMLQIQRKQTAFFDAAFGTPALPAPRQTHVSDEQTEALFEHALAVAVTDDDRALLERVQSQVTNEQDGDFWQKLFKVVTSTTEQHQLARLFQIRTQEVQNEIPN